MRSQLIYVLSLLVLGINICSCTSPEETNGEVEIVETSSSLIGDWKGHELFWSNDSLFGEGFVGWDLQISSDSIHEFSYPNTYRQGAKLSIVGDSLFYHNTSYNCEFAYQWSIEDTVLSLVGYSDIVPLTPERDSITFIKTQFNTNILQELKSIGFNTTSIERYDWQFDIESTKKYLWKEFDTNIFSPPMNMSFHKQKDYWINHNSILYKKDTFQVWMLDDRSLLVRKIFPTDTISLNYTSVVKSGL
ncbi:MAG: hypothetical protein GQ574_20740 [Crocinitomix sp.]|nr:hypothetical protein [Crocinitomix sp.]